MTINLTSIPFSWPLTSNASSFTRSFWKENENKSHTLEFLKSFTFDQDDLDIEHITSKCFFLSRGRFHIVALTRNSIFVAQSLVRPCPLAKPIRCLLHLAHLSHSTSLSLSLYLSMSLCICPTLYLSLCVCSNISSLRSRSVAMVEDEP